VCRATVNIAVRGGPGFAATLNVRTPVPTIEDS
jgi:hypothetical protein